MKAKKMARSYEQKADPDRITPVEYSGPQEAFDHFNLELFDGSLPDVFITYQRKAHSHGYFSADRFSGRSGEAHHHELALNPDAFIGQTDKQILQTLVHEQHHVWQHAVGKPAPRGYHNKEWAAKMKSNGLQPSSTGMVGGKETGQHMLDYVIPGGRFEQSYERLADTGWKLNLESAHRPGPKGAGPNTNKGKFSCEADCGQNAWGKPSLDTVCVPCLIAKLEAAGIDVAILDGVRMRDTKAAAVQTNDVPSYETITPVADVASYDTNIAIAEPAKPKRGRPKGSKNKAKREKTAGQELAEALSRLDAHERKKQQHNDDADVALEISPAKIRNLNLIIWRMLEHHSDEARGEWSNLNFLTEEEKTLLQNIDRAHPKLGDYHEARLIERNVTERRKKKWEQQKDHGSHDRAPAPLS